MSTSIPLSESIQITLDGSGNGSVLIGPTNPYQVWIPSMASIVVELGNSTVTPSFQLYQGNGANGQTLGGTYNGAQNSTSISGVTLYPGQKLFGQWTGGPAGAIAILSITGTMEVP